MHLYAPKSGLIALGTWGGQSCTSVSANVTITCAWRDEPLLAFCARARRNGQSTLSSLCTEAEERTAASKISKMSTLVSFHFLAWYSAEKLFMPYNNWHSNGLKQIRTLSRRYLKCRIYKQCTTRRLCKAKYFPYPSVHVICTLNQLCHLAIDKDLVLCTGVLKITFTSWTPFYKCSST